MVKKKSRPSFRALFKKRASPAQVVLVKEPRSKLRFVSPTERAENPDKFSPKGSYLVRKSVKKVTGQTTFIRAADKTDWRVNLHHAKAAKLRAKGELWAARGRAGHPQGRRDVPNQSAQARIRQTRICREARDPERQEVQAPAGAGLPDHGRDA